MEVERIEIAQSDKSIDTEDRIKKLQSILEKKLKSSEASMG
ncbi:hypothetical protein ACFPES_31110 [Paenibacillus sp. GCM10023248]|nr:hypothetical protein [Paenibacillus sp. MAHUQ-63]